MKAQGMVQHFAFTLCRITKDDAVCVRAWGLKPGCLDSQPGSATF